MSELTDRLRCRYPMGPMVNGEPEFGWRDFSGPAPKGVQFPTLLMVEAANEIDRLTAALAAKDGEIERLRAALGELIACRSLKERIRVERSTMIPEEDSEFEHLEGLMSEYAARSQKAWIDACTALRPSPPPSQPKGE